MSLTAICLSSLAVLILLTASPAMGQLDSGFCTSGASTGSANLPLPPTSFHTNMAARQVSPDGPAGRAYIAVDANSSRSAVIFEQGSRELHAIFNDVTGQMLVVDRRADRYDFVNCAVTNATTSSSYGHLTRVNFLGSQHIIPTGKLFSTAGMMVDKQPDRPKDNIMNAVYMACYFDDTIQHNVEIYWYYPIGSQSPMEITMRYRGKGQPQATDVMMIYAISPLRDDTKERNDVLRHHFMAPRGVYCKGLVSTKTVPHVRNRFSFGVEQTVVNLPMPEGTKQPFKIRESYDERANITMMEGDGIQFANDQGKYGAGRLAKINDFSRGIAYIKNMHIGNCSYERIPENNWDSNQTPNGPRLKSPDDFYYPSLASLQYKGCGVYRDTDVDVYVGYKDDIVGGGSTYAVAVEYFLQIKTSYDALGRPVYEAIPRGVYSASSVKFHTITDIFDFSTDLPRSYDHDISDCFTSTQEQHFELILSTSELEDSEVKYIDDNRDAFVYSLVTSLSSAINVSPLRVFQPSVSLFAHPLMLVEVTISERVTVPGYTPSNPETQLSDVTATLTRLTSAGQLSVEVLEGDMLFKVPIRDFVSMDSRGTGPGPTPGGMSGGAAAGLAIGMLLLGALLAVAAIFAIGYFRGTSPFGFQPFGGTAAS